MMPGGASIVHIANVGVASTADGRNDLMLNARLPAVDGTRTSATDEPTTPLGKNDSTPNDNLRASPTGSAAASRDATSARCVSRCSL